MLNNGLKEVLGPFPIIVAYVPYFVCDANLQKITVNLINWLMGNNVNIDAKEIQKAIDFLIERDHEIFLLLLQGKITVQDFGPIFVPIIFFTQTPDVLIPEDFEDKRNKAKRWDPSSNDYQISEQAQKLKMIKIHGNPAPQ